MILIRESEFDMEKRKLTKEDLDKVRHIEGFPIGKDEDIIALSDPPYYTACPNPFIADFIKEHGTPYDEATDDYHREPFASDVSEGKNDPIYNAHTYHTKVPWKAVMRYILHYTNPGDIVFDGFCGTGMTALAAQMCGNNSHLFFDKECSDKKSGRRYAIINDISPAAQYIAYNYNNEISSYEEVVQSQHMVQEIESEFNWMYETNHDAAGNKGQINYVVWSDVFICPQCGKDIVFWDAAVNVTSKSVSESFSCKNCGANIKKRDCDNSMVQYLDSNSGDVCTISKQVPVLISYTYDSKRYEKKPDAYDLNLIDNINNISVKNWYPLDRMCDGSESRRNDKYGLKNVYQFYTKRNLIILAALYSKFDNTRFKIVVQSINPTLTSKLVRYNMGKRGNGVLSGTLYLPSLNAESNVIRAMKGKLNNFANIYRDIQHFDGAIASTGSSTDLSNIPSNSIDYIFTDPPFGNNLNYSELNFIWESWLKVKTQNIDEAVINPAQGKGIVEYQQLMTACFVEFYRILKPNRWMTVEFHNSKNVVWNSIQESLLRAGFIIADVRTLDKKQGSFKQVNNSSAVKRDLVISAYKPKNSLMRDFTQNAGTEEPAWAFVRQHLANLPVVVKTSGKIETVTERQAFLLFDRMVAYHIMQGLPVPIDAADFYKGLDDRFLKRDRMYFLPDQVNEYDLARSSMELEKADIALFVTDEKSAIGWLYVQLDEKNGGKRQTYQVLQPKFMQEVRTVKRTEKMPELITMLEENFLEDDSGAWYVPDPAKSGDVAKLREKNLLKEFQEYQATKGKLKVFRSEAIRVGFAKLWKDKEYKAIVALAERLPEETVQEDPNILMYYDISLSRV